MTDEMFGVITTVNAERFWRCNQPSQVSQTETSKRRSQSFCLSVFLPPASLSWQHLWASITHPRQSVMCMVTLFLSATKTLRFLCGFDYQFLQLTTVATFQSCGPLTCHPVLGRSRAAITQYLHVLMQIRQMGHPARKYRKQLWQLYWRLLF